MASYYYLSILLVALSGLATSTEFKYKVAVFTGGNLGAGTDANVYIKFLDSHGNELLAETKLKPTSYDDPYERNHKDVAYISVYKNLGEISSIEVKRDDSSNNHPDWDLNKITIEDPSNDVLYIFNCDCELDKANKWKKIRGYGKCNKKGYELEAVSGRCKDVDECKQASVCPDRNAICTNIPGSYHCDKCRNGYIFQGTRCEDVNECTWGNSKCEHKCVNTPGSFVCRCPPGFQLAGQFKCEDVDECQNQPCNWRAKCVNVIGSYKCECPSGYTYHYDTNKCKNINECTSPDACNSTTSSRCIDYDGGHKCVCKQGFYNENSKDCKDIDECQSRNLCYSDRSTCENLEGDYRCNCFPGYLTSINRKKCIPRSCSPLIIPSEAIVSPPRCTVADSNSFKDVCVVSCKTGYHSSDSLHSQLTCNEHGSWNGTVPTCMPNSCKSLPPLVDGRVIPSLCSSGGTYRQTCSFICEDGYKLKGVDKVVCQADSSWNAKAPSCIKLASDLWIRCPSSINVVLEPGQSSADVSSKWELPKTSSNPKYILSTHTKNDRFPVGRTFVTWTVSNDKIHYKNCSFGVTVADKEKPVAVDCPKKTVFILIKGKKALVHLKQVEFTDNVAVKSVEYSDKSPVELTTGIKLITVTAKDTSNNIAYCMYKVEIKEQTCGPIDAPFDGDLKECQTFPGTSFCAISCRGNKVIFNATGLWSSRIWSCLDTELVYTPTARIPDCVEYTSYDGASCPAGKVLITSTLPPSPETKVKVCGACPTGAYYDNGRCKECPEGTYQDTTGNLGKMSCKKCGPNTSSKPGSRKLVDCKASCSPGSYSGDGFHPCKMCQRGEYQDNFGSTSCNKCPSDRNCTRHISASSNRSCGPCPAISSVVPSSKTVKFLQGSTVGLFCYMKPTDLGSDKISWKIHLDAPDKKIGREASLKKLYDLKSNKQIGLQLKIRGLKAYHAGNYECVVENQFGEDRKRVRITVLTNQGNQGSASGPLNDDE